MNEKESLSGTTGRTETFLHVQRSRVFGLRINRQVKAREAISLHEGVAGVNENRRGHDFEDLKIQFQDQIYTSRLSEHFISVQNLFKKHTFMFLL